MLADGTYHVDFESNLRLAGFGFITIRNGSLWGSDDGFRYRGYVKRECGLIRGRAAIVRKKPGAISVFGPAERFEIVISGSTNDGTLRFSGQVLGAEHLRLRFKLTSIRAIAAE